MHIYALISPYYIFRGQLCTAGLFKYMRSELPLNGLPHLCIKKAMLMMGVLKQKNISPSLGLCWLVLYEQEPLHHPNNQAFHNVST